MGTHRDNGKVVKMVHSGPSSESQKLETVTRKNASHMNRKDMKSYNISFKIKNRTQEVDEELV